MLKQQQKRNATKIYYNVKFFFIYFEFKKKVFKKNCFTFCKNSKKKVWF